MSSKYSLSGVDVNKNEEIVINIKEIVESSYPDSCKGSEIYSFGNFAGAIPIPNNVHKYLYKNPKDELLLVSTMDGVGTKTELVLKHSGVSGFITLGMDLVNHCVNDLIVGGGIPLCFLDYIASSKLDTNHVQLFIRGIVMACKENSSYLENQITLVGGESAEMPDTYIKNKYDFVGTMVGYQLRSKLEKNLLGVIKSNDLVLGFKSNSPHTNGYSLIRKAIETDKFLKNPKLSSKDQNDFLNWCCLPHLSYLGLLKQLKVKNIKFKKSIHITGGGWKHNPPRILPENLKINFDIDGYWNDMFDKEYWNILQEITETSIPEMIETFNCGVGLMIIIEPNEYKKNIRFFNNDLCGKIIGEVVQHSIGTNQSFDHIF